MHTCTLGRLERYTAEVRSGFVGKIQLLQDVNEKVLKRLKGQLFKVHSFKVD